MHWTVNKNLLSKTGRPGRSELIDRPVNRRRFWNLPVGSGRENPDRFHLWQEASSRLWKSADAEISSRNFIPFQTQTLSLKRHKLEQDLTPHRISISAMRCISCSVFTTLIMLVNLTNVLSVEVGGGITSIKPSFLSNLIVSNHSKSTQICIK